MASVSEPEKFFGVIDACRCVLANFEGKLEHFKNYFLSSNFVFFGIFKYLHVTFMSLTQFF
jgi:hypothetical protein